MKKTTMASEEEGHGDGLAEYRCVSKLRRRRLTTYPSTQGYHSACSALISEMDEFFNTSHLQRLMREGNWDNALRYVARFIPNYHPDAVSIQGSTLFRFLHMQRFFAKVVAGNHKDGSVTQRTAEDYKFYLGHGHAVSHGELRIRCIILSVLSDTIRASMDWEKVRRVAAERIGILVERTPELKRHILYKRWHLLMPHKVLPIGFSFHQRRHVKKRGRRPSKHDLARVFHYIKEERLFFPSDSDGPSVGYSSTKEIELLADLLDESLIRGRRLELCLESLQHRLKRSSDQSGKEGDDQSGKEGNFSWLFC